MFLKVQVTDTNRITLQWCTLKSTSMKNIMIFKIQVGKALKAAKNYGVVITQHGAYI